MSTDFMWGEAGSYPELYEALAVPAFFQSFAERLLDRAGIADGERVLDVATGTGVVARMVARRGMGDGRVVGFDLTPAMLDVARAAPGGDQVEWVVGDGQELPFDDGAFDVVLCQQGLQFFPDPVAGAGQMRRVLAGGGRAFGACWHGDETSVFETLADVLGDFDPGIQQMARLPFSMTSERLEEIFRAAGFSDVEVDLVEGEATWSSPELAVRTFMEGTPLSLALAGAEPERVSELRERILERVRPQAQADGTIRESMATHLAAARG